MSDQEGLAPRGQGGEGRRRYEAVIFDLFDTVIHFDYSQIPEVVVDGQTMRTTMPYTYPFFARFYPHIPFERFHHTLSEVYRDVFEVRDADHIEIPAQRRFELLFERLGLPLDGEGRERARQVLVWHMERLVECTIFPEENRQVFEALRRRYRLAMLSNFDYAPTVHDILKRHAIHHYFTPLIISEDVGVRKPRREIFEAAITPLGIRPEQILFVGDTPEADILGGKQAGLDVAWINWKGLDRPLQVPPPDYTIIRLKDLLTIL